VPCSGSVAGASGTILRSTAELNAYLGSAACANPSGAISLSGFDFTTQSIVILQYQDCGNSITFDLGTGWWGGIGVDEAGGFLYVGCNIGGPGTASPETACSSYAIAIPPTTESPAWTISEQSP